MRQACHIPTYFCLTAVRKYRWNRTQVGYTYDGCDKTVWNVQATKISGQVPMLLNFYTRKYSSKGLLCDVSSFG